MHVNKPQTVLSAPLLSCRSKNLISDTSCILSTKKLSSFSYPTHKYTHRSLTSVIGVLTLYTNAVKLTLSLKGGQKERDRERERETDRQTDRDRERHRHRERDRQRQGEQIERDRKSATDTTLTHPVNFRIKHSLLTPDHISLSFINKASSCAESGLMSTDRRFLEAAVALDSEISAKSCSLATPVVRLLCCALKHRLSAANMLRFWNTRASSGILGSQRDSSDLVLSSCFLFVHILLKTH